MTEGDSCIGLRHAEFNGDVFHLPSGIIAEQENTAVALAEHGFDKCVDSGIYFVGIFIKAAFCDIRYFMKLGSAVRAAAAKSVETFVAYAYNSHSLGSTFVGYILVAAPQGAKGVLKSVGGFVVAAKHTSRH